MPEDLSALSFCKDHFCKNDIDPKIRVPSVPSVPRYSKYTWYTYFSVRFTIIFQCCWRMPCFRALKINGNGNSKVLDRRTKPFHQIVLLQTMHPVYETMGVFTVSDKIPRNSKVGYMPVWTEYRTHKMKAILEKADFSLFGASAPLWGVAFAPNCKSKIWRNLQYECTQ